MKLNANLVVGLAGAVAVALSQAQAPAQGERPPVEHANAAGAPRAPGAPSAIANGSGFNYQGQLKKNGAPVNAVCNFRFDLYDAETGGVAVFLAPAYTTVTVTNGLFSTVIDPSPHIFANGDARWLEVTANCPGDGGDTVLAPRSALRPVPFAMALANANKPKLPGPGAAATVNNSGWGPITIGADGLALISSLPFGDLLVLHCGTAPCNAGNVTTTVDSVGFVNSFSSIAIGADGLGLISYGDDFAGQLKVLHCGNVLCNSGNVATTVDSAGGVGRFNSLTIGADGLGLISYHTYPVLKVLHCGNALCNTGNVSSTVDSAGFVGLYNSITIGADGLGLISYWDLTNASLKVLHCGNALCNSGNVATTVDSMDDPDSNTSITLGADGLGLISYYDSANGDLKVLHCGNALCNSGNVSTTVASAGDVGKYNSITIGADGLGLISYYDETDDGLMVLHCGNALCNSGNVATRLDSGFWVGRYNAITLGADGLALISYSAGPNGQRVFRCSNPTCTQYTRVGR